MIIPPTTYWSLFGKDTWAGSLLYSLHQNTIWIKILNVNNNKRKEEKTGEFTEMLWSEGFSKQDAIIKRLYNKKTGDN